MTGVVYSFVVANIDSYHPILFTNDLMETINKFSYLTKFHFGKNRIFGHLADDGFFIFDNYIIIDFNSSENLSHLEVIKSNGEYIKYDILVNEIKSNIRNIQISKILN